MAASQTSSRLQLLQARFQQKQLQEKEQKLLQLYDQQQQRAHQVAQRGSAGSNGSNGSGSTSGIVTASGKVRHMFEERRQNSVKGIDKSYPLEPLNGRLKKHSANKAKAKPSQNVNGRRNNVPANRANVVKADANGTSNRAASLSRESYASSSHYKDSLIQRESFKSYASSREDHGEPNETNGYGRHYEINIDDVIDKDAMERNRLLAKFDQVDVERRRQFDSEEFLGDELPDKASRRSSLAEQPFKGTVKKNNASPTITTTKKPAIPTGTSVSTTARNFNARASDLQVKKNLTPYPSSKSPDNLSEQQKSRPAAKATSLKFLSRLEDSNGDLTLTGENGFSTAALKSSASAVDSPDSTTDSRNPSFDDEKPSGFVAAAQRTTRSPSSNSSMVTSRSIINGGRPAAKTKATPVIPTPAARSSPSSKTAASNDDSLSTCKICNRRFAADRIGLHEQICAKTSQKKRKQFDVVTHRVRGTELESFVQKPNKKQVHSTSQIKSKAAKPTAPEPSKSNWRRKHEDFINAIRSAKQMQAHLASGGKLSDLPPPPPSDTSDYIQCPYCSRKFNQAAADRHIPKCENMQHNKPRAPPRSRR